MNKVQSLFLITMAFSFHLVGFHHSPPLLFPPRFKPSTPMHVHEQGLGSQSCSALNITTLSCVHHPTEGLSLTLRDLSLITQHECSFRLTQPVSSLSCLNGKPLMKSPATDTWSIGWWTQRAIDMFMVAFVQCSHIYEQHFRFCFWLWNAWILMISTY